MGQGLFCIFCSSPEFRFLGLSSTQCPLGLKAMKAATAMKAKKVTTARKATGAGGMTASQAANKIAEATELKLKHVKAVVTTHVELAVIGSVIGPVIGSLIGSVIGSVIGFVMFCYLFCDWLLSFLAACGEPRGVVTAT